MRLEIRSTIYGALGVNWRYDGHLRHTDDDENQRYLGFQSKKEGLEMGDKGGKKDKEKSAKQKQRKQLEKDKQKKDKQTKTS